MLGVQESERMREMETQCSGKPSNCGLAFVKTMKFYGRSKAYEAFHKSTPLLDLLEFKDTIGQTIKQEPIYSDEGGLLSQRINEFLKKSV